MDYAPAHREGTLIRPAGKKEPLRTIDAVHLSTMLVFVYLYRDLNVLSFDDRIRRNAQGLGLPVL